MRFRTSASKLAAGLGLLAVLAIGCGDTSQPADPPKVDPSQVKSQVDEPLSDRPNTPGNDPR
ncbi:MAG: hypothetical protein SFX74_07175 [Fimbriimonadaceae bacterium]|nr:hypothetical protein [Fimbriimonadaceae bacterium]